MPHDSREGLFIVQTCSSNQSLCPVVTQYHVRAGVESELLRTTPNPMNTLINSKSRRIVTKFGALFLATLAALPAIRAHAADIHWIGGTASYTNAASWSTGTVPGSGDNAIATNGLGNVIQINNGDPDWTVNDISAGGVTNGAGAFVQSAQTVNVNGWMLIGSAVNGAGSYALNNGTLNIVGGRLFLCDQPGSSGSFTMSSGVLNKSGDFIVLSDGGWNGQGARTAVFTQNGGVINSTSEFIVGNEPFSDGTYNLTAGTNNVDNWFSAGRFGGKGKINVSGGVINKTGGGNMYVGEGVGTGEFNFSGGTINVNSEFWVGNGGTCIATQNMSGSASMTVANWIAIGRNGGAGTLNLTNGTITKIGSGNFAVGAGGGAGAGLINQYGGWINNSSNINSYTYLAENSGNGTWNMHGGLATLGVLQFCQGGNGSGTLNLYGGVIRAFEVNCGVSGANGTLNFEGGTLQASSDNGNFFYGLGSATVGAGGAVFDSQTYSVTVAQALADNGGGGLTKIGSGTVTLSGANSYSGPTLVNAGTLSVQTDSAATGNYTVASGAQLSLKAVSFNGQLSVANFTLTGPAPSLGFDLGNFGNPSTGPLNVTGTFDVNGTVTVNVADSLPQVGQFPLVSFAARTGSGNFVIGSLPVGVVASIVTNGNNIELNITSVNLPRWDGQDGGNWDIGLTTNWVNIGTGLPTFYGQGNAVLFDDNALGTPTVNLTTTVNPGSVTANNSTVNYTMVGSGKISGATGITKSGTGSFAVLNTGGNNHTGKTILNAGTLVVTNLANGGSPSAIGASSASPTNLVLSSGTLSYEGPAGVSINRGYSVTGPRGVISVQNSLTLSGPVTAATSSGSSKAGPGTLIFRTAGTNVHSGSGSTNGYRVEAGSVVFDGTGGPQTNDVAGAMRIGSVDTLTGAVTLSNATLNVASGGLFVGNAVGATGTLAIASGAITKQGGGEGNAFAFGNFNGVGVGIQTGGTVTSGSEFWVGNRQNNGANTGTGDYTLSGGTLNVGNWFAIGRFGGAGTFTMTGGTLNKTGGGNLLVGAGNNSIATLNQSGGTIDCGQQFLVPENGNSSTLGTFNISGTAVFNVRSWVAIGRGNATGAMNVSGGAFAKIADAGSSLIIAADGPGTLTQTGGSISNTISQTWIGENRAATWTMSGGNATLGFLHFGRNGGGTGTLNLNGGTIATTEIAGGAGLATNNYNGGTIRARANTANFLHDFDAANVLAGGLIVDSDTFTIGINQALLDGSGGGGLTKNGSGTLRLNGVNTYTGTTLVNAGTLGGTGTIAGPVSVAAGATLSPGASIGVLTINNSLTLAGGSTTAVEITMSGVTNDLVTGLTGVSYNGALVVTNVGASPLVAGTVFKLFNSAAPGTGNFTSVTILPAGLGTFNPATGELTITSSGILVANPPTQSGNYLILSGTGGTPGGSYSVLTSTNVGAAMATWTTNTTGTFNGFGAYSNALPIIIGEPARFFRVKQP